jgi:hypothetical protein
MVKIDWKNDIYRCQNWCVINWPKNDEKWSKFEGLKIDPKVVKNWFAMGGSKIVQNR